MILVTGGAGYIGSHAVLALLDSGYDVVIVDDLSVGHRQVVERLEKCGSVRFEQVDLKDYGAMQSVFAKYQIEAVLHFAARSLVGESMSDPQLYYRNNVGGTVNLLSAMLSAGVKRIIFSSTASVYGEPQYVPIDELHQCAPINTYGRSKLIIENIMDDYDRAYGLRSVRLRYFNVVGADHRGRTGEWHNMETHLVPNVLKSYFEGGDGFCLYGDDYATKDGTCVRDYVDVEDLAHAHLLALEYLKQGGVTEVFNLGTREGNTVKEVIGTCESVIGRKVDVKVVERRAGDPQSLIADSSKAKRILGWQPTKELIYSVSNAYRWEKHLHEQS